MTDCADSCPKGWDAVFLWRPPGVAAHKKERHKLWEIYGSDKYTLFYAPQNSFSSAPQQCVEVIDDSTVGSPCPLLKLFMLSFLSQMQIYLYNSDDFDSLSAAIKERRIIAAMAVFFQVKYHQD